MKKIILSLALITAMTGAVNAQEGSKPASREKTQKAQMTPEERAKKGAERAGKELGLSAEQKTQWEAAALERIKANQPLHEKMKGSTTPEERKSLHAQGKANVEKFDATVTAFLTAEQKTKWTAMKEKRKAARKNKKDQNMIDDED
ncbi:MAG: hypothetical protein K0S12_274 [Bacteroidetes bacterium]|jgi:hypothetical protein|nr:hypothetical protein [Bacteroidota bacterium]